MRPVSFKLPSPELYAILKRASDTQRAGRFDQAFYEQITREAIDAGADHVDLYAIDWVAFRERQRPNSLLAAMAAPEHPEGPPAPSNPGDGRSANGGPEPGNRGDE